jgi:hypothetical protein
MAAAGINGPLSFWYDAIKRPGATQMQHLRRLVESRPYLVRVPDQTLLASDPGDGTDRVQATRGSDGSYAFVYTASGRPFTLRKNAVRGDKTHAFWFDPHTGKAAPLGVFPAGRETTWTPPSSGRGHNWVLVLDDATRRFPAPGQVRLRPGR